MVYDIDMLRSFYSNFPKRVDAAREQVGRPLTLAEKILYAHLYEESDICPFRRGEDYALLYLPKWCLGLFLTMLPCVAVMWALTVLFGFLCVAHVQNFFNQRSTDCNCWSEYHLYFGGICVVYYLCEKEGNPQCGKYYLHDYICFMVVTDCRVWRICTIFDFCKMSCFAMPINFIKFNFVK